jgi:hypothetical protein
LHISCHPAQNHTNCLQHTVFNIITLPGAFHYLIYSAVAVAVASTAYLVQPTLTWLFLLLLLLPRLHNSWRSYNAQGGGGSGTVTQLGNNKLQLTFDAQGKISPAV